MCDISVTCEELTELNLLSFDTSQVTDMSHMFLGCMGLTSLDLSNFNTSRVTNMHRIFDSCTSLETIYVGSGWTTANLTTNSSTCSLSNCGNLTGDADMFVNCTALFAANATLNGGTALSSVDKTYAYAGYNETLGKYGYLTLKQAA